MSWDLVDQFYAAASAVTSNPKCRAVLLTSEGKNFCVGGDIRAFDSEEDPPSFIGRLARRLHESLVKLSSHPAPVIVGVQGAAAGAGLSLVAGADIALAGSSSSFTMAYTGIGLTADGGATLLLLRIIGLRRAQELAYLSRRLLAPEAAAIGLVTRVVDDAALAEEARTLAFKIAAAATAAYGSVKRLLAASLMNDFPTHLEAEAEAIENAMATVDGREGVAAFLDRRSPRFTGN